MNARGVALVTACIGFACGPVARETEAPSFGRSAARTTAAAPVPAPDEANWAEVTRSPWPAETIDTDARASELAASCGTPDAALRRVAVRIVERRARGLGTPDSELLVAMLRAAGEPHIHPRLLSASGRGPLDGEFIRGKLTTFREASGATTTSGAGFGAATTYGAPPRCGVALATTGHGGQLLVAVAVDALADLEPLPVHAHAGQWLTLEAHLHVPATSAKLVVLGPRGAPRSVPTSLDARSGVARARFALDRPGAFTVQLVGDVDGGPRPLLEARVFADTPSLAVESAPAAPGEEAGGGPADAPALARMVTALRKAEELPLLARDAQLDTIAAAHAARMRDGQRVAHDLGEGDLRVRFEAAGLVARAIGENVASAATIEESHRILHASPSHRMNLLRADYTHLGVGVAQGADGTVYVCEVFAAAK